MGTGADVILQLSNFIFNYPNYTNIKIAVFYSNTLHRLCCAVLCCAVLSQLKDVCGVISISTIIVYSPADNLSKIIIVLLDYIAHSHKHKHLVKTASEINYLLISE